MGSDSETFAESLARSLFLARKYLSEVGGALEFYSNGFAIMFRVPGDPPNPIENEGETWIHLGNIEA